MPAASCAGTTIACSSHSAGATEGRHQRLFDRYYTWTSNSSARSMRVRWIEPMRTPESIDSPRLQQHVLPARFYRTMNVAYGSKLSARQKHTA